MREVMKKMGTVIENITSDLKDDINSLKDDTWCVKNFGLMVDGSYGDGEKYGVSKEYINKHKDSRVKMRMFVVRNFVDMVAFEYDISYGYAQKVIVGMIDKATLEKFNDMLIQECIDAFVEDDSSCGIHIGHSRITRVMNGFND